MRGAREEKGMDGEAREPDEGSDLEQDPDGWNLPQSPLLLAVPPAENWPEREAGFEDGLPGMDGAPRAAA
jgi:hypothetical protein